MTTQYYVRNAAGHLKAKVSATIMARITSTCPGFWREYQAKGKAPSACYEFSDDVVFGINEFALYLWKGDMIIPC